MVRKPSIMQIVLEGTWNRLVTREGLCTCQRKSLYKLLVSWRSTRYQRGRGIMRFYYMQRLVPFPGNLGIKASLPTHVFELKHHGMLWDEKKRAVRDEVSYDRLVTWSGPFHSLVCAGCKNMRLREGEEKRELGRESSWQCHPDKFFFTFFSLKLSLIRCLMLLLLLFLFMIRHFFFKSLLLHWSWPTLTRNPIKPHVHSSHKSLGSSSELLRKLLQVSFSQKHIFL